MVNWPQLIRSDARAGDRAEPLGRHCRYLRVRLRPWSTQPRAAQAIGDGLVAVEHAFEVQGHPQGLRVTRGSDALVSRLRGAALAPSAPATTRLLGGMVARPCVWLSVRSGTSRPARFDPTSSVLERPDRRHRRRGGTIENSDALPRALSAGCGWAAAVHVVEYVEERLEESHELT